MPGSATSGDDIDIVLAALLKGLQGIDTEELDGLLKDLPMPEPGAKGEISVKEAAEVTFIAVFSWNPEKTALPQRLHDEILIKCWP